MNPVKFTKMIEEIFDYLPDAILIVGQDGRIQHANTHASKLFGYSNQELTAMNVESLIPERQKQQHAQKRHDYFSEPHIRQMGTGLELCGLRKDSSEFYIDITLGPLGKKQDRVVCAIRDMTEDRQLKQALADKNTELHNMTQQLWQAAKLATMGELAASIAHELNNPLSIVSLRLESLMSEIATNDSKYNALKIIAGETDRMATLVSNLLQFSRKQTHQISTLDVCKELEHTIELIHYHLSNLQIAIVLNFDIDIIQVQADRQALRQLFLNILTNAADAMLKGGTLTISVKQTDSQVLIKIMDTGSGIIADDLPKVMESFFTTKPEGSGTGLGLAICRRIVEGHKGKFSISSPGPGKGATVHITLPHQLSS